MPYPPRVQPGDVILVHAGLYVGDRFHYMNGRPAPAIWPSEISSTALTISLRAARAEKPIVIKAAGDGEVIFDGAGCQTFFNLMARTTTTSKASRFATRTWLSWSASKASRDRAALL